MKFVVALNFSVPNEVKFWVLLILVIDLFFVVADKQLIVVHYNDFCYRLDVKNPLSRFSWLTFNYIYMISEEVVKALNLCCCYVIFLGKKHKLFTSREGD